MDWHVYHVIWLLYQLLWLLTGLEPYYYFTPMHMVFSMALYKTLVFQMNNSESFTCNTYSLYCACWSAHVHTAFHCNVHSPPLLPHSCRSIYYVLWQPYEYRDWVTCLVTDIITTVNTAYHTQPQCVEGVVAICPSQWAAGIYCTADVCITVKHVVWTML